MKKLLLLAVIMIANITNAQIKLSGVVKDSTGNPLEMANLIAINNNTKKLDSYGFTDSYGNYKLNLKKNATYSIKASYVGMKTSDLTIVTQESDLLKDIILELDETLDEVEIISKMPVTVKGDTIVYNADSFKSGTEKKLGDVLKKLPGVEVNDDGEIQVEGKTVKKVMVEGKDFFDGDSKLAVKNIPANAIDKVEVLKNHSEVSQMSRVTDNEDNIVINLKLKEGKKNFWFGEVVAGVGLGMQDERYLVHPKLFYYNPKYSVNVISDFNNIGEIPFTRRDYFKFTGGFRGGGGRGTSFNVASSDIGFLTMRNDKAKEIETRFGAVNFSYSPKQNWDLSGFAIYSGTNTDMEENTTRNYINPEENNPDAIETETTQSSTNQKSNLGLIKLSSSYKKNENNQFDYDIFIKVSDQNEYQNFTSNRITVNGANTTVPIDEVSSQNPFSISQNANYYYTLNDKNIFSFEAQHLWQNEDPFYNAKLAELSFADQLGLTSPQTLFDVSQNKRVKTNKLDVKIDYYYVLNAKSNLNFSLGSTLSTQQFNSDVFQVLDNGNQQNINNTNVINDVEYTFNDYFGGLHYKFITGIFTFDQGFTLHQYSAENIQLGTSFDNNFTKLLPDASIKVALKKSETLRLNYSQQVSFTDINSVAEGYVFNNYNRLYSGNRELESALSHNISLSYFSFNMFNYTNVFANINYNKRIDAVKGLTEFNGVDQTSTSINSVFPDESISANANFQKSYRKFKLSLGGNVGYSKSNNLFFSSETNTNENRESNSFTQLYRTRLSSNFRDAPNFDVGYNVSINKYDQGGNINTFTTHSPFINFDAFITNDLVFNTKYTYNNYRNEEKTLNTYSFWDADLTYQKKDSKWEYKIGMTNLLNTKSLNQDDTNTIFNSTSAYIIQPRYATFSVKYNL
ncbi:outer membrane beta-barrel protein [Tenacibaculum adriaticum]|uniref:Outer membrane beta-barrel protein n=1 Tax=Tenacibaculum adriaticum TaxID=413713 RepID=A0A5S5DW45_9FLAO|nr:TonB-dependent receptor [Tenacibaculum adriaticum]TYP99498.1 outer membrane beta-barrel protein [Tenacibaculum adriaticum]